jgi:hypothetical protein
VSAPWLMLLWACGAPVDTAATQPEETAAPWSMAADVQPIFDRRCADGCHVGGVAVGLTADLAYAELVNVPSTQAPLFDRVEPGRSDLSYVIYKLRGTHRELGGMGDQMPREGEIDAWEIERIVEWIDGGALP